MHTILFRPPPETNPHTEIPGLQMLGNYRELSIARVPDLSRVDFQKFQADVLEPPGVELFELIACLHADAKNTLRGSAADGDDAARVLEGDELERPIELLKTVLRKRAQLTFAERHRGTGVIAPPHETATWADQKREAEAFLANPDAVLGILPALADARGLPIEKLAKKILAKAARHAKRAGTLLGREQKIRDRIKAARNLKTLRAVEADLDKIAARSNLTDDAAEVEAP